MKSVLDYNLSTAVCVGLTAVGGVAAQTGFVVVYLDQAYNEALAAGQLGNAEDVLPAAYSIWRRWQFSRSGAVSPVVA